MHFEMSVHERTRDQWVAGGQELEERQEPVARYWPECNGGARIPDRCILTLLPLGSGFLTSPPIHFVSYFILRQICRSCRRPFSHRM